MVGRDAQKISVWTGSPAPMSKISRGAVPKNGIIPESAIDKGDGVKGGCLLLWSSKPKDAKILEPIRFK